MQPWNNGQIAVLRVIFNFGNLKVFMCGDQVQHQIEMSLILFLKAK